MERNSVLYRARRKCQVVAHRVLPDALLSKIYYRIVLNKKLNLKVPRTFNEKIQWMKLYYYPDNPLVVKCSDKYEVREYIKQKGYGEKLVPLIGVWDRAEEIEWDNLPTSFVLKCNHGCAYNIVISDRDKADRAAALKQLNKYSLSDS